MYIPKIDFIAINFSRYFKSIEEEQNLRKVAKSLDFFLTTPIKKCNPILLIILYITIMLGFLIYLIQKLQLMNTKPVIKNKLKTLLNGLEKFKVQTVFVLDYKKRNDVKIYLSSTKLIASNSDIDKAFNLCIKAL